MVAARPIATPSKFYGYKAGRIIATVCKFYSYKTVVSMAIIKQVLWPQSCELYDAVSYRTVLCVYRETLNVPLLPCSSQSYTEEELTSPQLKVSLGIRQIEM